MKHLLLRLSLGSALALPAFDISAQSDYFKRWELPQTAAVYNIQAAADGGAYLTLVPGIAALARVDATGDMLWVKRPTLVAHEGTNLHVANGQLILVGTIGSQIDGGNMPVIHKMTLDGDTLWTNGINGAMSDISSLASVVLSDGSVVVSLTGATDPLDPNTQRPFLSRTSASGVVLWTMVPGFQNDANVNRMAETAGGDIWTAGYHNDVAYGAGLLMRLSPAGELLESYSVPSQFPNSSVTLLHVQPQPDGRIILWGRVSNGALGQNSWATFTIAANGTPGNWTYYGTQGADNPTGVAYRADGSVVVSGNCGLQWVQAIIAADGTVTDAVSIGSVGPNNMNIAMALSGNDHVLMGGHQGTTSPHVAFARVTLGSGSGCVAPFELTRVEGVAATLVPITVSTSAFGNSEHPIHFPFPPEPMVVENLCIGASIAPITGMEVAVWPNPTDGLLNIDLGNTSGSYQLIDPSGRTVVGSTKIPGGTQHLDLSGLAAGLYVLRVSAGNGSRSIMVVRR